MCNVTDVVYVVLGVLMAVTTIVLMFYAVYIVGKDKGNLEGFKRGTELYKSLKGDK